MKGKRTAAQWLRCSVAFALGIVTVLALAFAVHGYDADWIFFYRTGFDFLQFGSLQEGEVVYGVVFTVQLAVGIFSAAVAVMALFFREKAARRLTDCVAVLCFLFLVAYMVCGVVLTGNYNAIWSDPASGAAREYSTASFYPLIIGAVLLVIYFAAGIPLSRCGKKAAAAPQGQSASEKEEAAAEQAPAYTEQAAPEAAPVHTEQPAPAYGEQATSSASGQAWQQTARPAPEAARQAAAWTYTGSTVGTPSAGEQTVRGSAEQAAPSAPQRSAPHAVRKVTRAERVRYLMQAADSLRVYKELLDAGALSQEEYRRRVGEVLWENCVYTGDGRR